METVKVLKAAKALISDPERWTQGFSARTAVRYGVPENHPDAVSWCSVGALAKIAGDNTDLYYDTLTALQDAMDGYVVRFNDSHTHPEVMAAFDRAIELAEAEANA